MATENSAGPAATIRARPRRWVRWILAPAAAICLFSLLFPYAALMVAALVIAVGVIAASVGVVVVMRRFVDTNSCEGSVFREWRPSKRAGAWIALRVLAQWAPFGALSIILWWGNGWIIDQAIYLIQSAIVEWCGSIEPESAQLSWTGEWMLRCVFPDVLVDTVKSASSGLSWGMRVLMVLPFIITVLIEIERWLSLALLLWLTVRSLGYFLVRMVVAEQRPKTEVFFDRGNEPRQGVA